MFRNDLPRAEFRGFIKRNIVIKPRCSYHARLLPLAAAERTFHHIAHAIHHAQAQLNAILADGERDRLIRNKFRLSCHNRFARTALRQFVHNSGQGIFVFNLRKNHKVHEPFDKCRFARSNGADDADVNIPSGTFLNIPINACACHNNLRLLFCR